MSTCPWKTTSVGNKNVVMFPGEYIHILRIKNVVQKPVVLDLKSKKNYELRDVIFLPIRGGAITHLLGPCFIRQTNIFRLYLTIIFNGTSYMETVGKTYNSLNRPPQ